jgi:hypothetical protein
MCWKQRRRTSPKKDCWYFILWSALEFTQNGIDVIVRNDLKGCTILEFRRCVGIEVAISTAFNAIGDVNIKRQPFHKCHSVIPQLTTI